MARLRRRRTTCARCRLRIGRGEPCPWCGYDSTNEEHRDQRRKHRVQLWHARHNRAARQEWMTKHDAEPFGTCPYCHQWTLFPLCDWCGFDTTDLIALDAQQRYREHQRARRADRWRQFRQRRDESRLVRCAACDQWTRTDARCTWCDADTEKPPVSTAPAPGPSIGARVYGTLRGLLQIDVREHVDLVLHILKWIGLGAIVGALAGLAGAAFLATLTWATDLRLANPWLIGLLPIGGLAVGLAYHYGGGRSDEGNNLIIDEIHEPTGWVPKRMAPLVFIGTVVTQLFGGSAGREGTSIQMSGSLTDAAARALRVSAADRRIMLISAIAGGFGAVFGVPLAGAVFGLEVQAVGRIRYDGLVPCLTASLVGDLVVRALGVHHTATPALGATPLDAGLIAKVALAGLAFGLVSVLFSELTHGLKRCFRALVPWAPGRPFVGGLVVIALTLAVGSQTYNGLSLGLIHTSLTGGNVSGWAWLLKLLFTAVTLGALFQGGEVTPLFVIGAALGSALAAPLGISPVLLAALGFVAVFAGATNTPLACTIMGVELFGSGAVVYFAVACVVSYVCSSHRGIYNRQRVDVAKNGQQLDTPQMLSDYAKRRPQWLPPLPSKRSDAAGTEDG
jgi:H+/Cl- antiporter ClcA